MPAWSDARVAILGGDAREFEVIRGYLEAGCSVSTYGVIPGTPFDHLAVGSAREAVDGAQVVVTPMPGHSTDALVIGYGRIGSLLARDLRGLGARVTIAARRRAVAVRAFADGYAVCQCTPEALATAIARVDLTYTTAPEWLLTPAVLGQARPGALVMDLVSP